MHLVAHADGVVCPITALMHLSAALVQKDPTRIRPCVVISGGHEPAHWGAYSGHDFLSTVGRLKCCAEGGCWRPRTQPLGDGSRWDSPKNLCLDVVRNSPHCMEDIRPEEVIRRIDVHLKEGRARELTTPQARCVEQGRLRVQGVALDLDTVRTPTARMALDRRVRVRDPLPDNLRGRGLVSLAYGLDYLASAWVHARWLRHLKCTLFYELWLIGFDAMLPGIRPRFAQLGVVVRTDSGWEPNPGRADWVAFPYKLEAINASRFREVFWLDVDNFPTRNQEFLFEKPGYRQCGALMWPDRGRWDLDRPIWRPTGIEPRDEPECLGAEMLFDKTRTWKALRLAQWLNRHSDFYYRHMHVDKDTWRLAFHKLMQPFAMAPHPMVCRDRTFFQFDFQGKRLFQHRIGTKFRFTGPDVRAPDFWQEDRLYKYLEEFRQWWPEIQKSDSD